MPVGNGDFGLNVWVQPDGDLHLLLGKTDAWDENSINLKLGRLRIALFGGFQRFGRQSTPHNEDDAKPIMQVWAHDLSCTCRRLPARWGMHYISAAFRFPARFVRECCT